jgi:hypothetical protein
MEQPTSICQFLGEFPASDLASIFCLGLVASVTLALSFLGWQSIRMRSPIPGELSPKLLCGHPLPVRAPPPTACNTQTNPSSQASDSISTAQRPQTSQLRDATAMPTSPSPKSKRGRSAAEMKAMRKKYGLGEFRGSGRKSKAGSSVSRRGRTPSSTTTRTGTAGGSNAVYDINPPQPGAIINQGSSHSPHPV